MFLYGMSSRQDRNIPPGYVSNIENWIYDNRGNLETQLGWETISKGLDSGSYPAAQSGGWDSATYGEWKDYCYNSDDGKVALFAGGGICDTDTTETFQNATSNDIALPGDGESEFRGVVYFSGEFLIYTDLRLYKLDTSDGGLTSMVDFANDCGADYSPVLKIIPRFGQLWVITEKGRVFWGDTGKFEVKNSTAISNEPIKKTFGAWQYVDAKQSIGSVTVQAKIPYTWQLAPIHFSYKALTIRQGMDCCYVWGDPTNILTNGEKIFARSDNSSDGEKFTSAAANHESMHGDPSAGDLYVDIDQSGDRRDRAFQTGETITISDDNANEKNVIKSITYANYYTRLWMETALTNSYVESDNGKVTSNDIWKVDILNTWDKSFMGGTLQRADWTDLTVNTDYDLTANPFLDDDIDGHIRLISNETTDQTDKFRVSYTPQENPFTEGACGYMDIAEHKGGIVAVAEGPDRREAQGSEILYIFKDNGDIHAIVGHPGPDGTEGTMDPVFVCSGLKVRNYSIQTNKDGLWFGVLSHDRYKVYFMPHGIKWEAGESIPELTGEFRFDSDIPFGDSTYTVYERTAILGGDTYIICFPNSTSGIPSTNGFMYSCTVSRTQEGWRSKWTRLKESIKDEYEDDQSVTIADAPSTIGFYYHGGNLFRVYQVKTGHDYSGNTRYYEIARYGWLVGSEECKCKYVMTKDNGDTTYTTVTGTEYFKVKMKTGMMRIANRMTITKIAHFLDIQGDDIDFTYSVWKDLSTTVIDTGVYPRTISDLTDKTGSLNLLKYTRDRFSCEYFQFEFIFDNIKYNSTDSRPGRLIYTDVGIEIALRSGDVLLTQEDND